MKRKTVLSLLLLVVVAAFCVSPAGSYYYGLIETNALIKGKLDLSSASTLDVAGIMRSEPVVLSYTSGTGYSIGASTAGVVFEIPLSAATEKAESDDCAAGPAGAGTTVYVFDPTEATDGRIIGLRNTSGTTAPIVCTVSGATKVITSSAVTKQMGEDYGDTLWLQASWGDTVGWARLTEYSAD